MVLGVLCFQSTQEGYAEELSTGGAGVGKLCSLPKQIFSWFLSVLGERLAKGTERRPQSKCGKGCWAAVEAVYLCGSGGCRPDPFPNTKSHWRFKGENGFKAWFDAYPDV